MHKPSQNLCPSSGSVPAGYAGVDVSKDHLDVCAFDPEGCRRTRRFRNTASGHQPLVHWLSTPARVVVESTGGYGLSLALHAAEPVEVMVANPEALRGHATAQMH